jgi:hypothetical protein
MLDPALPLGDTPPKRWAQLIEDVATFIADGWAEKAHALSWTAFDLIGCDRDRPFARIDQQGLLWTLNGRKLVALTAETATIASCSGARLTYRRKPGRIGRMLPWPRQYEEVYQEPDFGNVQWACRSTRRGGDDECDQ